MDNKYSSPIEWMVKNPIPVNFLMLFFLIGGYFSYKSIKREVFPEIIHNIVTITVPYPGAQPKEIERSIIQTIESEIQGIDGIKKVFSESRASVGSVIAELENNINLQEAYLDIKNAVDSISTFPINARQPRVALSKSRALAVSLVLYGNQPFHILHNNAQKIKNELSDDENINLVQIEGLPDKEVVIEITKKNLRKYDLSIDQVSNAIRRNSRELSAGEINAINGDILVKTNNLKEYADEFKQVPILTNPRGDTVFLGDIAKVYESYKENEVEYYYNGKPAIKINTFSIGDGSPIKVAETVKKYIQKTKSVLKNNISLTILEDRSQAYKERIELLNRNALTGLLLVLLVLGLFLEIRLAFWVMLGVPISILGSFILLKIAGGSLNMVSLFAFIVTLGIVVDDAVIIGESIYEKRQKGTSFVNAAIWGAKEMLMPVTFAIFTNMVAFCPLLFVPGITGDIFLHIPLVILSVFFVSLVESLFILPSHLAHKTSDNSFWRIINIPQRIVNKLFYKFSHNTFRKCIVLALKNRYTTFVATITVLALSICLVLSDYLKFQFLPDISKDSVQAKIRLIDSSTKKDSRETVKIISSSAFETSKEFKALEPIKGIFSIIRPNGTVIITAYLPSSDKRNYSGTEFADLWNYKTPTNKIPKLKSALFLGRVGFGRNTESDLSINILHPDEKIQEKITHTITDELSTIKGVSSSNSLSRGKKELSLTLKPQAHLLNISGENLARQVRSFLYGNEALRFQREENEILVLVRLPKKARSSQNALDNLVIKAPTNNTFVPLKYLANVKENLVANKISRVKGKRVLAIKANVNRKTVTTAEITKKLNKEIFPKLKEKYPEFNYTYEGESEERNKSLSFLPIAFLFAFGTIYALISMALKSYVLPVIVMLSIPFGIVGAILGHLLLGYSLSISSMIGVIGLSGVVINDSLVFITTFSRLREKGCSISHAAVNASVRRLRPIILTSVTTFFGLLPMLFEPSVQAKFLIPMAISMSFGIIFATLIILVFIPCTCLIFYDFGFIKKINA